VHSRWHVPRYVHINERKWDVRTRHFIHARRAVRVEVSVRVSVFDIFIWMTCHMRPNSRRLPNIFLSIRARSLRLRNQSREEYL